MPRTANRTNHAVAPERKQKKRSRNVRTLADVQRELDEYHAVVERIGRMNIAPFSAVEEQQALRRRERGR